MNAPVFKTYGASGTKATASTLFDGLPELLTIQDIAKALKVSEQSARTYCRNGELPNVVIGRRIYVPRTHFAAFVESECQKSIKRSIFHG